jgi:hypothetical protein
MPIPALNSHGLLPKGIHDCTMPEIASLFSSADSRHKRARLFKNLEAFIAWIRPVKCFKCIYVDGSFVTTKEIPGDIDLVLELPPPDPALATRLQKMKLFDQAYVHKTFELHVFLYVAGFPGNDLRAFFQYLRPEEARMRGLQAGETKGILRVAL